MENFIIFLETHFSGVFLLLIILFCVTLFLNWLFWLFGIGRYKGTKTKPRSGFMFIFSDLMVKIITDFRHFLALVLVIIFAIALAYAFYISNGKVDDLSKALQAVVSTLGGLVGSIVGYYFGESAGRSSDSRNSTLASSSATVPVQGGAESAPKEIIKEVPDPDQPGDN